MKKILIVFGTRPEAIKLFPVIQELDKQGVKYAVLNTNQHDKILDDFLAEHNLDANYKLKVCGKYSDMFSMKSAMLAQINQCLNGENFASVIVQGDTLSALVGAEYGFFNNIPVYHVEAGMRTYNSLNPYPEETIRKMITAMSQVHFCPSEDEKNNLIREGIDNKNIHITGNTFADYQMKKSMKIEEKKQVLVTIHRRENIAFLDEIFRKISDIAKEKSEYTWLIPLHPNPIIVQKAGQYFSDISNVKLCQPLLADEFYKELLASKIVISDSGGVHEECLLNSKKIIILREVTERTVAPDFVELVPPNGDLSEAFFDLLDRNCLDNFRKYYGTGNAAEVIVDIILRELKK